MNFKTSKLLSLFSFLFVMISHANANCLQHFRDWELVITKNINVTANNETFIISWILVAWCDHSQCSIAPSDNNAMHVMNGGDRELSLLFVNRKYLIELKWETRNYLWEGKSDDYDVFQWAHKLLTKYVIRWHWHSTPERILMISCACGT